MQRIRKQNGIATIKIILDEECPVDKVEATLEKMQSDLKLGCVAMAENIPDYEEVKVDKDLNFAGNRKLPRVPTPEEPPE